MNENYNFLDIACLKLFYSVLPKTNISGEYRILDYKYFFPKKVGDTDPFSSISTIAVDMFHAILILDISCDIVFIFIWIFHVAPEFTQ